MSLEAMNDLKLAVLIDADNVPYTNIKGILEEIAKYGTPTLKRIYADWTTPSVSGWKKVLLDNAIVPIQQYSYTTGKNSTDSAMIIDAMDILYSEQVDGFCILSSDSDFTRLVTRLREAGMKVFGFGERKTPKPFIAACDKFTYIEIITNGKDGNDASQVPKTKVKPDPKASNVEKIDKKIVKLISNSINDVADEDGWAFLGAIGGLITKKKPDFDSRNYGFAKLTPLVKSIEKFEIKEIEMKDSNTKLVYVRNKE
ncbi:MAG TPA: NYN domain-containing protein [Bacillales bacterium]|nr:NYN domain-containing protein [Bacillales bacterium]